METMSRTSAGFTLVELLIALALSLVVLTSVSGAFISQRKTYDAQEQMTEMIQGTRAVMEIITREVKLAGFDPQKGISGHTNVVGIPYSANQLEIRADLDGDGTASASDSNELIIYSLDSSDLELERNAGQAWSYARLLAENIQAFTVTYWKSDGTTQVTSTADQGDIRQINITITARTAKPDPNYGLNSGYRTYTLTSVVAPPNLAID
ncbi:MAG: prepilin-type N-terminal cleavage/methylation domain-containing protein [Deltaproteobacteria bacterium]|nr:prepilin-type N-terminal cleavage/methylation domain-containing protein [Deltaproteobacteria bacterium]